MINIKNCNNIELADINIEKNCLNIKYAINWTGKTTIAKGIQCFLNDRNDSTNTISNLKPFKYLGDPSKNNPEITGLDDFNNISVFNEEYVNKYTFKQNEILENSFEIFIKDELYEKWLTEINTLTDSIRKTFQDNDDLNLFINDLNTFIKFSGKSWTSIAKSSSIIKWLWKWNKIKNIPTELKGYSEYIKNDNNVKWLWWQLKWKDYIEISEDSCPYCISQIKGEKEKILKVSEVYNDKNIEHLNKVIEVIESLAIYFTDDTNKKIKDIIKNVGWLTTDEETYLFNIKKESEQMTERLNRIKYLNFHTLKNIEEIEKELNKYKIDLALYNYFNSNYTKEKINLINLELEKIIKKIWLLKWTINKQKLLVERTIEKSKDKINTFLKYAWFTYNVDSVEDDETYKIILRHNDHLDQITNAKSHLSYGEKNAFALVLFMFEVINKWSDFIILDDPISSFDKNKKFAILNMLFNNSDSFRNKTVLILTHDFEPIIDIIYNKLPDLESKKAFFLENKKGILVETEIKKSDIKSFLDITNENINILDENINKLIYLRRLYELDSNKNEAYNLLANLFHKKDKPILFDESEISEASINIWTIEIKKRISDFDYNEYYTIVTNTKIMVSLYAKATNNYEKLQLYRILNNRNHENKVIKKFINESFHVENDYLFQLNPCKYEMIPQYIIDECDKDILIIE